jgi:hypothetical protein
MAKIDTWDGLFKVIENDLFDIMNGMNQNDGFNDNNPVTVVKQSVDSEVYQAYSPTWYETKFQLRDSVTATAANKLGNLIEVGIYHDKNKMEYDPNYPRHGSSYDIREILPEIIQGKKEWGVTNLFHANGAWRFARPYIEVAVRDLTKFKYRKWIKQELIKKGYRVV